MKHRFAHERHEALRELIRERGSLAVSDLAKRLKVSEMTVRRDLAELSATGQVSRVHGGAVAGTALRFGSRMAQHQREKSSAARKLIAALPRSGAVYLDGSTTVFPLADHLEGQGLTVATNNLDTFLRLHQRPGVEAILIGGQLNRATDNFVGAQARRCLDGLAFDVAVFSAYAVDAQVGPSEPAVEDAEVKQLVCERASAVLVAVNHQKLGTRAAGAWSFPAARATLATDLSSTDERLAPYRTRFAKII